MGPLSRYRTDNEIKRESCSERGSNELPPRGQEQHLERRISNVVSICAHTRVSRTRDPAISVLCARISEHVEECSGGGNEKKGGGGKRWKRCTSVEAFWVSSAAEMSPNALKVILARASLVNGPRVSVLFFAFLLILFIFFAFL